jgi:hypothetical protein
MLRLVSIPKILNFSGTLKNVEGKINEAVFTPTNMSEWGDGPESVGAFFIPNPGLNNTSINTDGLEDGIPCIVSRTGNTAIVLVQ